MKKIILLTLLCIAGSTHCSQWPVNFVRGFLYPITVPTIDTVIGYKNAVKNSGMKINPDKSIATLKKKLIQQEKDIRAEAHNQIYTIAKENGLNDTGIKKVQGILNKITLAYKESHNTPNAKAKHDFDICPENFAILKNSLSEKNMNIHNLNLINKRLSNGIALADCGGGGYWSYSISESFTNYSDEDPISINFYPEFHQTDKLTQQATCFHESTHAIEGHGIIHSVICSLISQIAQKDSDAIEKSKSFQKLVQIHERQAEVLPSLENPKAASLLRQMRSDYYYPRMLYGQHYSQLSDIDETHEMIEYLEQIKNISANKYHE